MASLRALVVERLMLYHRSLSDLDPEGLSQAVTSTQLGESTDIDPTQVRKDLASIGLRGKGRVGFDATEVFHRIRQVLGFDRTHPAITVGAGHLGGALAAYTGFAQYGLRVVAAFDIDPARIGKEIAGCPVKPIEAMPDYIVQHSIRLAIITTPAAVAQRVVDDAVEAGVAAVWNFAPVPIDVPPDVYLRNEHISLGFAQIAHHLVG